ncbi:E3 ubiquitin-protein ligase TRIM35-like [Puntigrus tetrazona]|uniref:E3 ubiquitin-protein ligase TRIM35-like n=1 Tax=Puntigrus tetrazona TaxID=1606681 RepID=UPI001C8A2B8C|nr:E3 ubiquitin-protein ligase TRIM35-like [Puntigrus tetrazona]
MFFYAVRKAKVNVKIAGAQTEKMHSFAEADFSCPVCKEIFEDRDVLTCGHSVCKECLQQFWRRKESQECPVCMNPAGHDPIHNLALKNLCDLLLKERNERRSSGSEEICGVHREKLKLFCLEDKQPVCLVCRDSQKHLSHTFRPIGEAVSSYKEKLNTALKSLQEQPEHSVKIKREFEKTIQHIKSQADHTESQIKQQFEKLHRFLRDEEEATISALREEEEQKKKMMKEKLEEINRHISALSDTIKDTEEMMKDNDVCFLKKFPVSMERVQISSQPDPQIPSGALIHVPRYLGNLSFRVWKKMQDIVQNTPVVLDPNTENQWLVVSDDLTSVRNSRNKQPLPNNPERFDYYPCVLGSEGFNSGTHSWDVEVKESLRWSLGITTASNQRKGCDFFSADVWSVRSDQYGLSETFSFPVKQDVERVRVYLDYDKGTVSFSDPVTNTHLHTFTTTFTDTVFPFFWISAFSSLRILQSN